MRRTSRMIVASIALWASGAAAQTSPAGAEGTPGPAPAQAPAPAPVQTPVQPQAPLQAPPNAAVPPAAPLSPAAAQQQGTPATVLDTQDYESLLGRSVRSAGGDELGRVIDVIIDKEGHPRAAIIDFGGFLGVGTRKIAVDWRALRFAAEAGKERRLSVALTRNQVRVSPEYKSGEPIVVLGPASPAAPVEGDQATAQPAQAAPPAQPAAPAAAPVAAPPQAPPTPEKAPDK